MASQRALAIVGTQLLGEGRVRATLELACGCVHDFDVAADRLVETKQGERIAVGKYPCPRGHELSRR